MLHNPDIHHRRSIRLRDYNYTQTGAYFVTVCTYQRECLLGEIVDGEMQLNGYGNVTKTCWEWLSQQYLYVELDEWVVMPNHLHGILVINEDRGKGGSRTAPTVLSKRKPLGRLIGAFKTISNKQINEFCGRKGESVWQRNYYEHIIRNEEELNRIREYIITNALKWAEDENNPLHDVGAVREPPYKKA